MGHGTSSDESGSGSERGSTFRPRVLAGLVTVLMAAQPAMGAGKKVLVVAPHEDDETIACAGAIRNAIDQGDEVWLLLVTTGGGSDAARERIKQTLAAMKLLGLARERILYLGYDDGMVLMCAYNNQASPDAICPGSEGARTFAPTEYITDYHTLVYGSPALYTRANVLGDIRHVLDELRPSDIYMPAYMETHNDHAAAALFTTEAVLDIKRRSAYSPTVHEYMIYRPNLPQWSLDALARVSNASADMGSTPYAWDDREALPVPKEMYAALDSGANLKHTAFHAYLGAVEGYSRFIKADEVFWEKTLSSVSYQAHVTASSERPDRPARNVIDGVALGAPFTTAWRDAANFHDFGVHEWIAADALRPPQIRLSWHHPVWINQVLLYDRPNPEDQVTRGELAFSDGFRLRVGPLPDDGSPRVIRFPGRWVTWMKLTITGFTGTAPGLSEIEAYGEPAVRPDARVLEVRDTAIRVKVAYPVDRAPGNRLIWWRRGTAEWGSLWPDLHLRSGTYVINGLTPDSTYDLLLVYGDSFGRWRHIARTVETASPEPPPPPPACRNCTLRIESATATSLTVAVIYPNSDAWGNRLIYGDLTTGELRDFGTPFEMHDGTYTITGLTPGNMYDIDLVYLDETQPLPFIDNIVTAATLVQ